jgi:hypothetical protein
VIRRILDPPIHCPEDRSEDIYLIFSPYPHLLLPGKLHFLEQKILISGSGMRGKFAFYKVKTLLFLVC